jgi:hypothetical protein
LDQADEVFVRTVIGAFCVGWEDAGRKFSISQMIRETIAAHPLAGATRVAAGAAGEVLVLFAFHMSLHLDEGLG